MAEFVLQESKNAGDAEVNKRLIPEGFEVPAKLETREFRLRMLTVHDVVKDYDAVITSAEHLHGLFGTGSNWPRNLTLEQNLIDLGWHQKEFQKKSSFAYTVTTLDEACCLGCVYIYPGQTADQDAEVFLWARQSELASGLEERLFSAVKNWIAEDWPFKSVVYPGRNKESGAKEE